MKETGHTYSYADNQEVYYFTFGAGHAYSNKYVKIAAKDYGSARDEMFKRFGTAWAFQYSHEEFKGQVEEFGLTELK